MIVMKEFQTEKCTGLGRFALWTRSPQKNPCLCFVVHASLRSPLR